MYVYMVYDDDVDGMHFKWIRVDKCIYEEAGMMEMIGNYRKALTNVF